MYIVVWYSFSQTHIYSFYFALIKFELPFVDVYRVREFEFTPIANSSNENMKNSNNGQSSVWNCDGEVITDPAVRVK